MKLFTKGFGLFYELLAVAALSVYIGEWFNKEIAVAVSPAVMSLLFFFAVHGYRARLAAHNEFESFKTWTDRLPRSLHVMDADDDDETRMVALTFQNGDTTAIEVPSGYHPQSDGGELIFEQLFADGDEPPEQIKDLWRQVFTGMP